MHSGQVHHRLGAGGDVTLVDEGRHDCATVGLIAIGDDRGSGLNVLEEKGPKSDPVQSIASHHPAPPETCRRALDGHDDGELRPVLASATLARRMAAVERLVHLSLVRSGFTTTERRRASIAQAV
jgi:hypothetical protein